MAFSKEAVSRAIIETQFNLRGHESVLGTRTPPEEMGPEDIYTILQNFIRVARQGSEESIDAWLSRSHPSLAHLALCKKLAKSCNMYAKEAVQYLISDIARWNEQMRLEICEGKRKASASIIPHSEETGEGRTLLALAEAFEVNLEKAIMAANILHQAPTETLVIPTCFEDGEGVEENLVTVNRHLRNKWRFVGIQRGRPLWKSRGYHHESVFHGLEESAEGITLYVLQSFNDICLSRTQGLCLVANEAEGEQLAQNWKKIGTYRGSAKRQGLMKKSRDYIVYGLLVSYANP